jgi:anti-anti-sigma factor
MADLEGTEAAEISIATSSDSGGGPVLVVAGELDTSNAALLDAEVTALAEQGARRIVFDFSGLRFMDSAGIAVLLAAASQAGEAVVYRPSPAVRRILEVTGLGRVISVET